MSRRFDMAAFLALAQAVTFVSCDGPSAGASAPANAPREPAVGVVKVSRKSLQRTLVVSAELVPFQQIDVYAKESGYVRKLNVDYGTSVQAGQVMAVLEIPELQMQLEEDQAAIKDATGEVARARNDLERMEAQEKVIHLQFSRLDQVAKSRPGLIAQQEIDDWQGRDLSAEAQVQASRSALESAQSRLGQAEARRRHDQVLFDYSKIVAPFTGVVTKRYANLGTLMQAGTNSSTQALPLVQLSEDHLFRLVIPVPESYVSYIRIGDPVSVRVPSLNRDFPGRVARFSVDVEENTRTMHTEVDVPNPKHVLMPGMYAEATLALESKNAVLAVPAEAVIVEGDLRRVWVVDSQGKAESRPVTIGVETPNDVEVVSGLQEGELVAVGDRSGLHNGQIVHPKEVQLLQYHPEQ